MNNKKQKQNKNQIEIKSHYHQSQKTQQPPLPNTLPLPTHHSHQLPSLTQILTKNSNPLWNPKNPKNQTHKNPQTQIQTHKSTGDKWKVERDGGGDEWEGSREEREIEESEREAKMERRERDRDERGRDGGERVCEEREDNKI